MNITISVPAGTSNHGNPQLLCFPAAWTDILTFLVTNYYAHAATLLLEPGIAPRRTVVLICAALILPFSSISRATMAILRHAVTERKNPLKRAARSRALCMVMKVPKSGPHLGALRTVRMWGKKPVEKVAIQKALPPERSSDLVTEDNQYTKVSDINSTDKTQLDDPSWWEVDEGYEPVPKHSEIFGEYWLDEEYYLAIVPHYADMTFAQHPKEGSANSLGATGQEVTIPNSYSVIQAFIGIVQALWAIATIYQARGDQIQVYGYAAFGLTVVPYAFMSVVNAVANLLTPQYASIFVIRTPAMTEAEQRGKGFFKAAFEVDLLDVPASAVPWEWTPAIQMCLPLPLGAIPVAIIGGLSKFQAQSSTPLQRGFTMAWLAVGMFFGYALHFSNPDPGDPLEEERKKKAKEKNEKMIRKHRSYKQYMFEQAACESSAPDMAVFFLTLVFSPPAIGGMVIVGLMLREYGNCSPIGG